jgi:hypothetical protein
MTRFPEHPGTLHVLDVFSQMSTVVPLAEVPESRQFVYLKEGVETHDPAAATERVPVVEVHLISVDGSGKLVPAGQAATIRIKEFGPDHRPLRSTILRRE